MIRLSQERNKFLLAVHGWSGTSLGLLLYAVILTGMVSVFAREIGDWSAPLDTPRVQVLPHKLDAAVRAIGASTDPSYRETLLIFSETAGRLRVEFHGHDAAGADGVEPPERGVRAYLHPQTLEVMSRHDGFMEDAAQRESSGALADFFVELHVRLHLPNPWGLLLTGILGLAMMVAAITGFVVHRHLIRELFTLRRRRDALLTARDTHVIAGTWNLVFAFVLAFTGSFFSFATAFGIPAIAMVAFGGDQEKLIETVVGGARAEDKTASGFADIDAMLADARARSGGEVTFLSASHWGRADAQVTISTTARPGWFEGANYSYDGATGELLRAKPSLGLAPSLGNDLFELMGPLHFGHFGGVISKAVWFALGFAAAYVALTGMLLWTARRASANPVWARFERAVHWMGFGLPLALAVTPAGYFLALGLGADAHAGVEIAFLAAAALASLLAWRIVQPQRLRRCLLALTGVALLVLPLLRWAAGGPGWIAAFDAGLSTLLAMDLALLIGGALCMHSARVERALPQQDDVPDEDDLLDEQDARAA